MLETSVNYCLSIILNKSTYSVWGGDSQFGDIIFILIAMTTNHLQKKKLMLQMFLSKSVTHKAIKH